MFRRSLLSWLPTTVLGAIFMIVVLESIFPKTSIPTVENPPVDEECQGRPIVVSYPYEGGMLDPWECKIQCEDKIQRYIVYTNGVTTPCEKLPGCLDYGEDYGITCTTGTSAGNSNNEKPEARN